MKTKWARALAQVAVGRGAVRTAPQGAPVDRLGFAGAQVLEGPAEIAERPPLGGIEGEARAVGGHGALEAPELGVGHPQVVGGAGVTGIQGHRPLQVEQGPLELALAEQHRAEIQLGREEPRIEREGALVGRHGEVGPAASLLGDARVAVDLRKLRIEAQRLLVVGECPVVRSLRGAHVAEVAVRELVAGMDGQGRLVLARRGLEVALLLEMATEVVVGEVVVAGHRKRMLEEGGGVPPVADLPRAHEGERSEYHGPGNEDG